MNLNYATQVVQIRSQLFIMNGEIKLFKLEDLNTIRIIMEDEENTDGPQESIDSLSFCNYKLDEVLALLEAVKDFVYNKNNYVLDWEVITPTLSFITSPSEAKKLWKRIAYRPQDTSSIDEQDENEDSELENSITFKYKKRRRHTSHTITAEGPIFAPHTPTSESKRDKEKLKDSDRDTEKEKERYLSPVRSSNTQPLSPASPQSNIEIKSVDSPQYDEDDVLSPGNGGSEGSEPPSKKLKTLRKEYFDYHDDNKKRIPWTSEEDDLLISGVDKLGEGNWTLIKDHTKLNRLPSQLSQHWQALKKRAQKSTDPKSFSIKAIIARQERQKQLSPLPFPSSSSFSPTSTFSLYNNDSNSNFISSIATTSYITSSINNQHISINNNNNHTTIISDYESVEKHQPQPTDYHFNSYQNNNSNNTYNNNINQDYGHTNTLNALVRLLEKEKQELPTKEESLALMRNLLRTAFSSIVYLRNIFPENCFSDHAMTGINIKALMPRTKESKLLISWLEKGVFDALDKHYLRTIIFGIYKDPSKESNLLESYNFNISYPDNGGIALNIVNSVKPGSSSHSNHTKEDIKKATVTMMRHLTILSQTLEPLPTERYLTIKLLYFDDVTPSDYEPPFFKEASNKEKLFFATNPVKIKVGCIETPFHSLSLKVKTIVGLEGTEDHDSNPESGSKFDAENETPADNSVEYCNSKNDIYPLVKKVVLNTKSNSLKKLVAQLPDIPPHLLQECLNALQKDKEHPLHNDIVHEKKVRLTDETPKDKEPKNELVNQALNLLQYEDYISIPKLRDLLQVSTRDATRIVKYLLNIELLSDPIFSRQRARKVYNEKVKAELQRRGLRTTKRKRVDDPKDSTNSLQEIVNLQHKKVKKCSDINDPLFQSFRK